MEDGKALITDGPFAETKEQLAGYYIIDCKDLDEAIEWALRCPTGLGSDDVLTIHPLTEASDIPPETMKIIVPGSAARWIPTVRRLRRNARTLGHRPEVRQRFWLTRLFMHRHESNRWRCLERYSG